ncbi:MAG: 2-oxo acid dehydrogenase subunit E2 [Rhodothermales bacterium]|nr:2-oxo acid dehydrogenase subunit E2 [Rhodothermales bacterium]
MAIPVEMPKMSDTMEEGVLVAWLVDEGAAVAAGDIIAQVETDKATMDLEVYDDGVLLKKVIGEGDAVPIGALIAVLGDKGEDVSDLLERYSAGAASRDTSAAENVGVASGNGQDSLPALAPVAGDGSRVKASPLAKKLAQEHGLDLTRMRGSGPEGRIVKRDIELAMGGVQVPAQTQAPAPLVREPEREKSAAPAATRVPTPAPYQPTAFSDADQPGETVRISQMRKAIARRLAQSKFTAPHFYLTIDVDMDRAVAARARVNAIAEKEGSERISFNDIITKACAVALRSHPAVNASYLEDQGEIRYHKSIHVAVAVAIDEGLITPVIRHADRKGLSEIGAETRMLAQKARDRRLQPEEFEGSTFTTSNLGMFGIEEFTAIINPPEACILAIGAIRDEAIVRDGQVVAGKRMKLTMSCDHRVVDGATGSRFLETLRKYLEEPLNLLL